MILYPAVDIMGARCVRLSRGKRDQCTTYYEYPEEPAKKWIAMGARRLHVVDLDAAFDARCFSNRPAVERILAAVDVKVQIGGGVRTLDDIRTYLEMGIARVIVGTSVLMSREFSKKVFASFGESVAVSIDSKNGRVALRGWQDATDVDTLDAVRRMRDDGARVFILTDIRRDGMLTEPNYEMLAAAADVAPEAVFIAAGGVSTVEHVEKLAALGRNNIDGAIIGKALYEDKFDLAAAIAKFPQGD